MFLFYFFSHLEAYISSNEDLDIPPWLVNARRATMVFHVIGGNVCLVVSFVIHKAYLYYLAQLWCGIMQVITAVALGYVAYSLAREAQRQCVFMTNCAL